MFTSRARCPRWPEIGCLLAAMTIACAQPTTPRDLQEANPQPALARRELPARAPVATRELARLRLRSGAPAAYRDSLYSAGAAFVSSFHGSGPVRVSADPDAMKVIAKLPWVEMLRVRPPKRLRVSSQTVGWGVDTIGAVYAQSTYSFAGNGVKVAIIDDGVACSHPDLTIWGGYDFEIPSTIYYCGYGGTHGTKAAGVIAALDNSTGVLGVAPQVKMYSLRVCDTNGDCDENEIIDALNWAGWYGMDVVSISIGDCGGSPDSDYLSVVHALYNSGVPVVVGHGANYSCDPGDPASSLATSPYVIPVAAHDQSGNYRSDFYQYSSYVKFSAPSYVLSLDVGGGTVMFDGVSSAVPHVAGSYALLISAGFSGVASMTNRLAETAIDEGAPGQDNYYGYGRIQVGTAAVPKPGITNLSWCVGGPITMSGVCTMTAATNHGAGTVTVRFVAYFSNSPGDSTVYDWGSATRDIYVPPGDYTLTIKTRARDAYNRYSAITNIWNIPVCTEPAFAICED